MFPPNWTTFICYRMHVRCLLICLCFVCPRYWACSWCCGILAQRILQELNLLFSPAFFSQPHVSLLVTLVELSILCFSLLLNIHIISIWPMPLEWSWTETCKFIFIPFAKTKCLLNFHLELWVIMGFVVQNCKYNL